MSKEFNPTDYMAAAERILTTEQKDAIARDMALQEWQQRPGKPASSTTTRSPSFKFATRTTDKRGNYLSEDYFDVPPDGDWHTVDIDVFEELMTLIKSGRQGILTREVICDAVKKMDGRGDGSTQRWTAYGFMNMVSDAVEFFAAHANWKDFLENRRIANAASKKHCEDSRRDHMVMMTRKSVEARRAKKLAQEADLGGAASNGQTGGTSCSTCCKARTHTSARIRGVNC